MALELKKEYEQTFSKPSVLIAGFGIVGKNLAATFPWAEKYDKFSGGEDGVMKDAPAKKYDFCFVSVPTPMNDDGSADTRYVRDVFDNINAEIYIIKSTIPPTTTESLRAETGKRIIFSPEYNGNTQHANVEHNFVVLGGDSKDTFQVSQLYQYASTAYISIYQVDSRTAELCKYMENSFLASKVVFCNDFYRMAENLGVNYNILREIFCADPRVNKSHTFVYESAPFYDSKCFNKDLPAIVKQMEKLGYDAPFVRAIIETNEKFKTGFQKNARQ